MHHLSIFSLKIYKSKSRRKVRWQVGAENEAMSSKYYIKFKIWDEKNTSSLDKSEKIGKVLWWVKFDSIAIFGINVCLCGLVSLFIILVTKSILYPSLVT